MAQTLVQHVTHYNSILGGGRLKLHNLIYIYIAIYDPQMAKKH